MNSNVILILDKSVGAPVSDTQLGSSSDNTYDWAAGRKLGRVYTFTDLSEVTVRKLCDTEKCEWVVAVQGAATAMLHVHGYKRILINPIITPDDVLGSDADNIWGFFGGSPEEEASYEIFQSKYPNAVWYLGRENLHLWEISEEINVIITDLYK